MFFGRGCWRAALVGMLAAALALGSRAGATGAKPTWQPVGLCGGGGLFNPAVSPHDPKFMMVECDMGSRFISRDGGKHWRMIHYRQIGSAVRGSPVLFHPTKPGVIYALSGYQAARMYLSRNWGRSWAPLPEARQPKAGLITRMYIDPGRPERLYIGTSEGKVLFTDDGGRRWQAATGLSGRVIRFAVDRTSPKARRVIFVGTPEGVFRSDDGGRHFVKKVAGLPAGKRLISFAGGSDGRRTLLYVTTPTWVEAGRLAGGVYRSTDRGESWQRVMNPKIDLTTRRSSRWAADLPRYSHIVANDADPARAYVACRGTSYFPPNHNTIYRTDDAGASWRAVFFADPRFKQRNVEDDWMTTYRGTSWVGAPLHMEISPTDPNMVMRTDGMFLFFTRDGGASWQAGHAVKATEADDDARITWANNGLVVTTTWNYYVDPHQARRHRHRLRPLARPWPHLALVGPGKGQGQGPHLPHPAAMDQYLLRAGLRSGHPRQDMGCLLRPPRHPQRELHLARHGQEPLARRGLRELGFRRDLAGAT